MNTIHPLAKLTIDAHGGVERWRSFRSCSADLEQGGVLWLLKARSETLAHTTVTVGLGSEWATHNPFGPDRRRSRFEPGKVSIESRDGVLLEALEDPRGSFAGHTLETPWSDPQLAYFAGCAMWTYLNTPFVLAWDDVRCDELDPWHEMGESWRRLRVQFPASIATHSTVQTLYVGADGLLRRHDYDVEITGGTQGAHYMDRYVDVSGIKFPTRRRIYPRQPDGTSTAEPLVVSIDLSNITLS